MHTNFLKTKGGFFLLVTFFLTLPSFAQPAVLRKGYAFSKAASYGREMKDLEGKTVKRPDSVYFLYLETKGKEKPRLGSVAYNGKPFIASVVPVAEKKVEAGKQAATQKTIMLQCASGYTFWRIELTPDDVDKSGGSAKGLTVKGKVGKRPFVFTRAKWTVLSADIAG